MGHFADTVRERGFSVVDDVFPTEVEAAVDALECVFDQESDIAVQRLWLTDSSRVAYMLPAKHPTFVELCTHPAPVSLARAVLGDDCIVAGCNGLSMVPGGTGQLLHRDHRDPTPGSVLYLHLVCPLDPFTSDNGATRIVPNSHGRVDLHEDHLTEAQRCELESQAVVVEAAAGSAICFDATVWHAGSANRTSLPRRTLHLFYCRRWVQPHWDLPGSIPAETAAGLSEEQRHLLGYHNAPGRYDHGARRTFGYGWG